LQPGTSHLFVIPTTYNITLRVTNTAGDWAEATHALEVINNPPEVKFQIIPMPASGLVPLTIAFIDQSTDPDGHAITYWEWDFGDFQTSNEQNTEHVYTLAQKYDNRYLHSHGRSTSNN